MADLIDNLSPAQVVALTCVREADSHYEPGKGTMTIWSSTHRVAKGSHDIPIGTPIAPPMMNGARRRH